MATGAEAQDRRCCECGHSRCCSCGEWGSLGNVVLAGSDEVLHRFRLATVTVRRTRQLAAMEVSIEAALVHPHADDSCDDGAREAAELLALFERDCGPDLMKRPPFESVSHMCCHRALRLFFESWPLNEESQSLSPRRKKLTCVLLSRTVAVPARCSSSTRLTLLLELE